MACILPPNSVAWGWGALDSEVQPQRVHPRGGRSVGHQSHVSRVWLWLLRRDCYHTQPPRVKLVDGLHQLCEPLWSTGLLLCLLFLD